MSDHFSIDFESAETERALRIMRDFLDDLRPFWRLVPPMFIGWMREQFDSEGAFAGEPWAALSDNPPGHGYATYKSKRYPGKGILIAEGDLRQAASRPIPSSFPRELVLTVDDPKLEYHQTGTDKMPARPLLFTEANMPPQARMELDAAADEYVRDIARRVGLRR